MVYNIKVKRFPSGLTQYFGHTKPVFSEYSRVPDEKKEVDSARSKKVSKSRSKVSAYDLALANEWDWFFTGTFDPERFNSFDYDVFCSCVKLYTQQLRDRSCKYLLVPEKHKSGRWHFHALISGNIPVVPAVHPDGYLLYDGNGRQIYNVPIYRYGFTTATRVGDSRSASGYICKYLTKSHDDVPKHKKRYWASRSLNRPTEDFIVVDDIESVFSKLRELDYVKETHTHEYGDFIFAEKH